MKQVSIIGFGRFGPILKRLLEPDFKVLVHRRTPGPGITSDLSKVYSSQVIFFCVPISSFESVIDSHQKYFRPDHLLIDTLSVKMHPAKILSKHLSKSKTQALLTHPMFGPDSVVNSFSGLPLIIDQFTSSKANFNFWKDFFVQKGLKVVKMTANEHDRLAAESQGLAHFIGRLLEAYGFKAGPIDSLGVKKLLELKTQTCNDTWQLFNDLQHFNPYTKMMRLKLGKEFEKLHSKLLPKKLQKGIVTIGIQGGRGSFNDQAVVHFFKRNGIKRFKIKYLFTADRVMRALQRGSIDLGQVATHNSVGGIVEESMLALVGHKLKIVDNFAIKIAHALMIKKTAKLPQIKQIITHPQVLAQCRESLRNKYPDLIQLSGKGKLIDPSAAAQALTRNKLPATTAVMGSRLLAELHNLHVVEDNLQDSHDNYTSFLVVKRD